MRQAFRLLANNRGFAAATLITIALGVGGTAAVFSVVYGVLLRPLPYDDAKDLIRVWEEHPGGNAPLKGPLLSVPTYHAWSGASSTLEGLGAFRVTDVTITNGTGNGNGEGAERGRGALLTPNVFRLLRVSPAVGRFFGDADSRTGAARVAVLGQAFWQERFNRDPLIVGRSITIDGVTHQIIGVAPAGFTFPLRESGVPEPSRAVSVYTPLEIPPVGPATKAIGIVSAFARLRPGAHLAQVAAEGTALARGVDRPFAELIYGRGGPVEVRAQRMADQMTAQIRPALLVLAAGIALVLCVACANVANLFLARGADRARELAVRAALGADRRRLLWQLLTESFVLSLAGGLLGLLLGWILTRALPAVAPSGFPRLDAIRIDTGFVLSAALAAIIVGTLSGLFPALRGSRVDLHAIMQAGSGSRAIAGGNAGSRARRALLIIEAALAVVLLVGATLLGRSFERLVSVDGGYDRVNVLTADVHMPPRTRDAAADATAALQFNAAVLERVRALPGVRAAGAGSLSPFGAYLSIVGFNLPGVTTADGHEVTAHALQVIVTPGYAEALGLHLEAGRLPRAEDASAPVMAMLVNRTFVKMYLSDGRPIVGRHFLGMFPRLLNRTDADAEIVGVVGDMLPDALDAKPQPEIFLPANRDFLVRQPTFVIKTAGDPLAVVPLLRQIVREANPNAAIDRIVPLADKVADSMGQPRFAALVLASFALLALILAVTGLYAVLAYHVAQRRRELGVRAALGATRRDLLWLVLREGLLVTAIGLACGIALASLLTRAMGSLLFGVTPLDAVSFAGAPVLLLIVSILACLIPARRAATLDPTRVLRAE